MRTWPPGTSWYSRDRPQQIRSGSQAGTVTAAMPPGLSTRATSFMACWSSRMCSNTSAAMTRSKDPSANGMARASPDTAALAAAGGACPSARMAPHMPATSRSSL